MAKEMTEMKTEIKNMAKQVKSLLDISKDNSQQANDTGFMNSFKEENIVKEIFWTRSDKKSILLDTGAPKSVVGLEWYKEYIQENHVNAREIKECKVNETFKFGAGELFKSTIQAEIPFTIKNKIDDNQDEP